MGDVQFGIDGMPLPDAPASDTGQGVPGSSPAPAADVQSARAEIARLKGSADFQRRYLDGDAAAKGEMQRLFAAAYPEQGATPGAVAPAAQTAFSDALAAGGDDARSNDPMDLAVQAAYQEPRGAWEYPTLFGPDQSAEETASEMSMKQAFFDAGVPVAVVNVLRMIGERNAREGVSGNPQRLASLVASGTAELQRRHGENAKAIIADAREAFERLDAASSDIGDALIESGLASNPDAIEALARWRRVAGAK